MKKRLISILLSLVLVLSLMPVMSLRAYAWAGNPYTALIPDGYEDSLASKVVHFNGYDWYIIGDNSTALNAGTVTLFAKDPIGSSKFDDSSGDYGNSYIKGYLEDMTKAGGSFASVANAIEGVDLTDVTPHVTGAKLWLLSEVEANALPANVRRCSQATGADDNAWWLRSPGDATDSAKGMSGENDNTGPAPISETLGVRPALKLNLAAVTFNSANNTFTPGAYIDYFPNGSDDDDELADKVVHFNGKEWYIIGDNSTAVNAGTVTLLAADSFCTSKFSNNTSNKYSESTIKTALENMTTGDGSFAGVASAIKTVKVKGSESDDEVDAKLYLLSVDEAEKVPQNVREFTAWWWLRSPGQVANHARYVNNAGIIESETGGGVSATDGSVRPALKLDLAYVDFASNTFTVNKYCPGITGLETGAIVNPTQPTLATDAWKGSYVYYGKYDGTNPTKYRVLDEASSDFGVTGGSLLLECDSVLYEAKFDEDGNPNEGAQYPNEWAHSDVKAGLNGDAFLSKDGNFTYVEKGAIAESTKSNPIAGKDGDGEDPYLPYVELSGEKVFLLDAKEATRITYGYSNTSGNAANRVKSGHGDEWWLRSPYFNNTPNDGHYAGRVDAQNGIIHTTNVSGEEGITTGVSPAFNVNLSSVIFSSLVSGTSGQEGAEYKLTLKDPNLTIAAGAVPVANSNNQYLIPYEITDNSDSATPTQVSVVVTDGTWSTDSGWSEGANLLQYSKLEMNTFSLSGTGTFTLDGSITSTLGTNYHVYVLAEDVSAGNATDYASAPVEITIPSYLLKYDANGGSGSMASKSVQSGETFTFPECGFTATEGKSFYHWKMSGEDGMYFPNGTVTIAVNCAQNGVVTVTAYWIDQPAAKVTAPPTAKTLTYTGSSQALVNSGAAEDGTMKYALGESANTAPTSGWDTAIPEGTEAKTYYVWYKVFGDDTHSDTTPVPLTVTIKNKPSPPSPGPGPSYSYYTVKYEMNGHGEQVSSQTIRSGLKAKRPQDPTAEEYYFAGWFEDATLTKEYDFSSPVRKNTTLYARWEEILYVVSFDLDGKGSIEPQWVRKNKTAERPEEPTAEGYTFDGWFTSDGTAYDFSTPVTKDITIYAKWEKVIPPVIVHRLYNPNSGEHFYTASDEERDYLVEVGWSEENGFMVPAEGIPVYRLYNPNGNDHHFTSNRDEAELLKSLGWIDEGIAFYTSSDGIPVYRAYNPYTGHHFFTADKEEFDYLITLGWKAEGIAWYAVA